MAKEIPWADDLRVTGLTLNPVNPRIEHAFENSPRRILFNRGEGYWAGSITFGPVRDGDKIKRIEAFFSALNEGDCYTPLSIRPTDVSRALEVATVSSLVGNVVELTPDAVFGFTAGVGDFILHVDSGAVKRVVGIQTSGSDTAYTLQPNIIDWSVGDKLSGNVQINIRLNTAVNLPVTPHWAGGWTMAFTEWRSRNVRT